MARPPLKKNWLTPSKNIGFLTKKIKIKNCIGSFIRTGWEIQCLPFAGFFTKVSNTALHKWGGAHQTSNHLPKPNI